MLQGQPVKKLHGDERLAVLLADVVDRADIGVIQRGRSLRFTLKAGERLWVSGNFIGKELESDEAMQSRVLSLIDHTHPAAPELLDDAVVRDCLADHVRNMPWRKRRQVNDSRRVVVGYFENLVTSFSLPHATHRPLSRLKFPVDAIEAVTLWACWRRFKRNSTAMQSSQNDLFWNRNRKPLTSLATLIGYAALSALRCS